MSFASELNSYCKMLPCTASELADACGISASAMSRYRSGQRVPPASGKVIEQLASGIMAMMRKYGVDGASAEADIVLTLMANRADEDAAAARFSDRLNTLMNALGLHNSEIAEAAHVDSSYVSRIRHSQREPKDRVRFARHCVAVASNRLLRDELMDVLPGFEGISVSDVSVVLSSADPHIALVDLLLVWLAGTRAIETQAEDVISATQMINDCEIAREQAELESDDFWSSGRWKDVLAAADHKVQFEEGRGEEPDALSYYGLEGARNAELAFIGNALERDEGGSIFLNSNLTSMAIAADSEFLTHHRSGLLRFLERGGHIDVVHNLRRPFAEILMGLKYWLPLYATGHVGIYSLSGASDATVKTMLYVSDSGSLSAEDIGGKVEMRRCHLSRQSSEVEYDKLKAHAFLERAKPIAEVYRMDDADQMRAYEAGRAERLAHSPGIEIASRRFDSLRIVLYPGECVVVAMTREPKVRAVVSHPRIIEVAAHLNSLLQSTEGWYPV